MATTSSTAAKGRRKIGASSSTAMTRKQRPEDLPNYTSLAYREQAPIWEKCRDLMVGTRRLWEKCKTYLPQNADEHDDDYKVRATLTEAFNAFGRAVRAMVGLICQRAGTLDEKGDRRIVVHAENIDNAGTSLATFARQLLESALPVGLGGIIVEHGVAPKTATGRALKISEEKANGLRPYWIVARAEDLLSPRVAVVRGRTVLSQLVVRECTIEPDGDFGEQAVTRYRVYRRNVDEEAAGAATVITCTVWTERAAENGEDASLVPGETVPIIGPSRIPFEPLALGHVTGSKFALRTTAPLEGLADLTLGHYRVKSGRRNVLDIVCKPSLVRKGYDKQPGDNGGKVPLGAGRLWDVTDTGDLKWIAPDGTAFVPTKDELEMIGQEIAAEALAFLHGQTRAAETAKAKEIDASAQNASLTSTADALEECINGAMELHAEYMSATAPTYTVNRDFMQTVLDPAVMAEYRAMEVDGQLSLPTLWKLLAKGNRLGDDFDADDEQKLLVAGREPLPESRRLGAGPSPYRDDEDQEETDDDTSNADPSAERQAAE